MAPLSVSVPPVTPWGEWGVQRGKPSDGEERRRGHQSSSCFILLFLQRWYLLCADQRSAPAALPPSVVGAGAVFIVRPLSLWELVDG